MFNSNDGIDDLLEAWKEFGRLSQTAGDEESYLLALEVELGGLAGQLADMARLQKGAMNDTA